MSTEFEPFNRDVALNDGYRYTTNASLSSTMANQRLTDATLAMVTLRGKRVLDMGCGDGTYSLQLLERGGAAEVVGVDPAASAIDAARRAAGSSAARFEVERADALPYAPDSFDVAHLRGVLHHMDNPQAALGEALRVAREVVVIEPNGFNPVLKVIERTSRYHREHHERSYSPLRIDSWLTSLGGRVHSRAFVGLVPFFCPDLLARGLKRVEGLVEGTPVVRQLACAVYVCTVGRRV